MNKTYKLKDCLTEQIVQMSLKEILEEINRDRSDDWKPYNRLDWREGLKEFTDLRLI